MHADFRRQFNAAFTQEKYQAFLEVVNSAFGEAVTFRIAESPVFVPRALKEQLLRAVEEIVPVIMAPDFIQRSEAAIPPHLRVPDETNHTEFLQLDFGICRNERGELIPQLIEMQGFPSLYFFQMMLAQSYRTGYDIPPEWDYLFNGLTPESYVELLRDTIVGDSQPERVVLLEVEPDKQNTRIDFAGARQYLGLAVRCLSEIKKDGRNLYYLDENGRKIPVERIYNRIIFDELEKRNDLPREWNMLDPVDAEWVGHPNWFFRLSKHTLPFLRSEFIPQTLFLNELDAIPDDLENWVLKPLFSFSGQGVKINVSRQDLDAITDPEQYILQRKVAYAAAIQTPNPAEPAKCEIRMMMVWKKGWEKPKLVCNLVRMSKGEMVGVRYNMGKDWVGASVAFFEP